MGSVATLFQSEAKKSNVDGAAIIYNTMTTPGTKHMLLFLNYILPKVDRMNLEFQSEYFRLGSLFTTISDEYRSIMGMFVRDEVIANKELSLIDPSNVSLYKDVSEIKSWWQVRSTADQGTFERTRRKVSS